MRVLISGLWAAEQPSGICRTVVNLIRCLNLVDRSLEVTLALGAWQRAYFEDTLGLGELKVEVVEIAISNRSYSRSAWYARELPRLARRLSADLVHLSFPAPVVRREFHCPVITTLHDLYPYDRPRNFGFPRVLFNRLFLRQAVHQSERIICVSEFTLERLREHFPATLAEKAVCIHNPIHLSADTLPPERQIPQPYLLAVAQHRANKNLALLLESFCLSKQMNMFTPETRLVIVGSEGPETAHLRNLAERLSITNDVLYLSRLGDRDLAVLYRDCELFISLSDIEGFGLPLAEALLSQARVVASDIPAHREIAGDQCEYVNIDRSGATNSVTKAMQAAIRRARPASDAVSHLSPSVVGSKYVAEYRRVSEAVGKVECTAHAEVASV
jgi:glycosyltransferase involved in cell wall biosynthesis